MCRHRRFSLPLFVRASEATKRVLKFFTAETGNGHTPRNSGILLVA
jgi:hypothetical protein